MTATQRDLARLSRILADASKLLARVAAAADKQAAAPAPKTKKDKTVKVAPRGKLTAQSEIAKVPQAKAKKEKTPVARAARRSKLNGTGAVTAMV